MAQVPAGKNRSGQLSKQTGDAWENQARRWLEGQGLRFIAANARERGGEIALSCATARSPFLSKCATAVAPGTVMRQPASLRKNNNDCLKPPVCGSADRMGALRLWIAVSMW